MSFKSVFISVVIAVGLILSALVVNQQRPSQDNKEQKELVRASGKCAECHRNETSSIVHQFEKSKHIEKGVTCLDCHRAYEGQQEEDHKGFKISDEVTSGTCKNCHQTEYEQFNRSRHAAPAWAAVKGRQDFTPEQIAHAEKYHKGATDRDENGLQKLEGEAASKAGCQGCHDIGQPNKDGSIGKCTECHSRHNASTELARQPETCGQCHMGPDHSQLEIYNESKHGALFNAQKHNIDMTVDPKELTTKDMPLPTCATCHMSGLEGMKVTHDVSERLSYWLFAPISEKRPNFELGQANMKDMCNKCHTKKHTDEFYKMAEDVVKATNDKVKEAKKIVDELRAEGYLTPAPFDEPIEFLWFDLWHYFGRTAKHGAFMGGPDYVQWHGNYELLLKKKELDHMAAEIRQAGKKAAH